MLRLYKHVWLDLFIYEKFAQLNVNYNILQL